MIKLSLPEKSIFFVVALLYIITTSIGFIQLFSKRKKYNHLILPILSLAITLEAVLMIFRAISIKGLPLTGLFESLIVLTIVFGLLYLAPSLLIRLGLERQEHQTARPSLGRRRSHPPHHRNRGR